MAQGATKKVVDYLPYLRGMIGHAECLSVGLSALIEDEKGRVLLEKRTDNGLYCLPGGSIDIGESVKEGVARELYEETGLEVTDFSLILIRSGPKTQIHYPNGDVTDYVDLVFYGKTSSEKLSGKSPDGESLSVFFCEEKALPPIREMLGGCPEILAKWKRRDFTLEIE